MPQVIHTSGEKIIYQNKQCGEKMHTNGDGEESGRGRGRGIDGTHGRGIDGRGHHGRRPERGEGRGEERRFFGLQRRGE